MKAPKKGGKPAKAAARQPKISHMVVTPGENGFLTEVHHVPEPGYGYTEPKKFVHDDAAAAGAHVAQMFGGKGNSDGENC